jgi:hypothetical protein
MIKFLLLIIFLLLWQGIISADTHVFNNALLNDIYIDFGVPAGALTDDSGAYLQDDVGHFLIAG